MAGMRGLLRTHRAVAIIAALVCVLSERLVLHAQAGYLSVVRGFIAGNSNAAAEMAKLPRQAIDAGVGACLANAPAGPTSCRPRELRSAALLHADAIDFLVKRDPSQAAFHVQAGARMLKPLERLDGVFVARWYAYVARIYLANRDVYTSRSVVIDGLSRFESADLYVARGTIIERQALARFPDVFGAMLEHRLDEGTIPNTLARAIVDYLKAISIDPGHTGARLRLTWIRLLQRDGRACARSRGSAMTRRELSLMAAFLTAGSTVIAGQAIFRGGVDLVEVDVSVMRGSVPVAGLTVDNFVVTDNGARQEVTAAKLDLPLRVTLVLDLSESVSGERLSGLVKASNGLVNALNAEIRRRSSRSRTAHTCRCR
jgi:hypothetical protein